MDDPSVVVDVFVDGDMPDGVSRSFVDTLAGLGVTGQVKVVPVRRTLGQLPWLVLLALPLQAFLSTVGRQVAEDVYGTVRRALSGLFSGRRPEEHASRPIVVQDTVTGLQIVLEPGLPDEAFARLFELDLAQFRLGPVFYDRAAGKWRSHLDEAHA